MTEAERDRVNEWKRTGQAVGGDLNGYGWINQQDALIVVYAYQFRAFPNTDTTYPELLRRANRLW